MKSPRLFACLCVAVFFLSAATPAFGLASRVFVSARSGNDANSCDNINTPCQTLAGAVLQVDTNGAVIVLDSGGYGPVTITRGVTIEAPAGVTAFIHPPSGDAVTVNAGSSDTVTLRGLTLHGGTNGIVVNSVGILNVEGCSISGCLAEGIWMLSGGLLNVRNTNVSGCGEAVGIQNSSGVVSASFDHCHLDGNGNGYGTFTTSPGSSVTTASYTTANNNSFLGWLCGDSTTGKDVINLEFCSASGNGLFGLVGNGTAGSAVRYSNCVIANNGRVGIARYGLGTFESRGNNTLTGNGFPIEGTITSFSPM